MLTSFFDKSKPINFLVVAIFMAIYYFLENFFLIGTTFTLSYLFKKLGFFLVYLFMMVLMNFIVKRNQVTGRNTFTIVLFALFTVSFSNILVSNQILVSGVFILLALRRIISLKSRIAVKRKIFDASFWICIATIFSQGSFLFLAIVFLAVLFYVANDYRNWIIPILAALCVFILYTCYRLWVYDSFFYFDSFFKAPDFGFSAYGSLQILLPLSLLLGFSLWAATNYLLIINKASTALKPSLALILAIWVVSVFVVLFSPTKNGSELLFFIIPVCIIGANYFQQAKDSQFKEILLMFMVVFTLSLPFFF